jgi:hypothetical protein
MRNELELVLGRARAHELQTLLRSERIMDRPRTAVQGNSTTVRQLAELGLMGSGGVGLGGYGLYNQDPTQITLGTLMTGLAAGGRHVDQRVMRNVADILTSQDPSRLVRDRITRQVVQQQPIGPATAQALNAVRGTNQAADTRSAITRWLLDRGVIGTSPAVTGNLSGR